MSEPTPTEGAFIPAEHPPVDVALHVQRWQAQRDAVAWRRESLGMRPMTKHEEVLAEAEHRFHHDPEFRHRAALAESLVGVAQREYGRWFNSDRAVAAIALVLADRDPVTLKAVDR